MADLKDYPEEHPETGKVKNPLTGNWITKDYARREGLLEQAKEHTQQHFKEQREEEASEEIDQLLQEAEEVDIGEAFEIEDEELERLDERADINHPEVPDSEFPNEETFDPGDAGPEELDTEFEQPPTPEGLDQAAQQQQSSGEYKGVYSGNASGQRSRQQSEDVEASDFEQKHEDEEVRYVRTEHGGLKTVHLDEENDKE